jgi:hypothetical protein
MNIWTWVLLAFVLGLVAERGFDLCKLLLRRLHYIRLEVGLDSGDTVSSQKQVVRGSPEAALPKPSLRGSGTHGALKQGGGSGKKEKD